MSSIRKSALELVTKAFARTHRKTKVKEKDIQAAIAYIDAKLSNQDAVLLMPSVKKGLLQSGIFGILNDSWSAPQQRTSFLKARVLLQSLSNVDYSIVKSTLTFTKNTAATATLTNSSTSTQSTSLTYVWSQVSGPNTATFSSTTAASPTLSAMVAGTYVFQVVATDSLGNTATTQVTGVM